MSSHRWIDYKRVKRYNLPGHIHFLTFSTQHRLPLLTNDQWRGMLADQINRAREDFAIAVWAYVLMPEHVHLLVKPRHSDYSISKYLQAVKGRFAHDLVALLKESHSPLLDRLKVSDSSEQSSHRVWLKGGGYDLNIYTLEKALEKAEYCHNNPVRRKLVSSPDMWKWSSYQWLVLGKRDGAPIGMDDWNVEVLE